MQQGHGRTRGRTRGRWRQEEGTGGERQGSPGSGAGGTAGPQGRAENT